MPIEFTRRGRTIVSTTIGDVDYSTGMTQLLSALHEADDILRADSGPAWHYLADIRESTEQRTGDELWSIASLLSSHRKILSGKIAIILTDRHLAEITRMFGSIVARHGMTIGVFASPVEAQTWLAAK